MVRAVNNSALVSTNKVTALKIFLLALACIAGVIITPAPPAHAVASTPSISGTVTFVGSGDKTIYINAYRQDSYGVSSAIPDPVTGRYSITGLAAGTYKLQFVTPGTVFAPQWWKSGTAANTGTNVSASIITLGATTNAVGFNATIRIGASVAGQVTGSGVGLRSVQVQAFNVESPYGPGSTFSTYTDESGQYRIQGLPPGNYKIEYRPEHGSGYVGQFFGGASTLASASPVTLATSQALTGKNVSLILGGIISGKVMHNARITGVQGIPVNLVSATTPQNYGSAYDAITDSEGVFTFTGIRPGKYKILFDTPYSGQSFIRSWWSSGVTTFEAAATITIASGQQITDLGAMISPVTKQVIAPAPIVTASWINGQKVVRWTKPVTTEPIIGYDVGGMTVTLGGGAGGGARVIGSNVLTNTNLDFSTNAHSVDIVSAITASATGNTGVVVSNPVGISLLSAPIISPAFTTDSTITVSAVAPSSSIPINRWVFKIFGGNGGKMGSPSVVGCNAIKNQSPGKITCTFTGLSPSARYNIYAFAGQDGSGKLTAWGQLLNQTTKSSTGLAAQAPGRVSVSGTPRIGATLTATTTGWASGADLAYEWYREGFDDYPLSIGKTYVPTNFDAGKKLYVKVSGIKAGYRTVASTSTVTSALTGGQLSGSISKPEISGATTPNPVVGDTLIGSWSGGWPYAQGAQISQTYKWLRDGVAIVTPPGATSYQLVQADVGHRISFAVVFSALGFDSKSAVSDQTTTVHDVVLVQDAPTQTPTPTPTPTPSVSP